MANSGKEPKKNIDATVGGLVWVRRRNGSWWPGKILGPEELPEGCVPTPRSGTPVQLLGRENASVDWYNLEKSKRVKAFHCGEYDECIKKLKESASQLSKKAAKYAEREDAILHALELERTRLVQNHPDLSANPVAQNGEHESPSASMNSSEVSESGLAIGSPDHVDSAREESNQWRTPNDSEDDGYEGVKRMRGLEDLGMGVASSVKKKRSQVALLKRKNRQRHRPLTKVMATATMVSVPVTSEVKVSALESSESKKNDNSDCNGVSCEDGTLLPARRQESDDAPPKLQHKDDETSSAWEDPESESSQKLFDVPLVAEEQHSTGFSDASQLTHVCARAPSSQSSCVEAASTVNEEHNGSGPTCEWRFKGKRNSRPRNHVKSEFRGGSWNTLQREAHTQGPTAEQPVTVNPSSLYDVSVEVKTGHRPQHVPYISLMSKLTGRPIIGHPLTIEVLDGTNGECYSSCCSELDYKRRPPAKSPKSRRNPPLSKKTRKLSSLTRRPSGEETKKALVEKLKGPSIACVPLKVVFSRINAALSGSMRAATTI